MWLATHQHHIIPLSSKTLRVAVLELLIFVPSVLHPSHLVESVPRTSKYFQECPKFMCWWKSYQIFHRLSAFGNILNCNLGNPMATVPERTPGRLIGLNMNQATGGSGGHRGPEKDAWSGLTCRALVARCCWKVPRLWRNPKFTLEGSVINKTTMNILYEGWISFGNMPCAIPWHHNNE